MKLIFLLSGDYIELGAEEVISLLNVKSYILRDRLMIFDLDNETLLPAISKKLALSKNIYKCLFECKINDLKEKMKSFCWNSVYKDNFCLRVNHFGGNDKKPNKNQKEFSEKNLAGHIWRSIKNPNVDLENPKTEIHVFIFKNTAYCGLLIKKLGYDFDSRKSHLRPFPHPSSLHPKVARALVNISEVKDNETMLDPFCGTGGFMIEAGLMNIKTVGYDIDKTMIEGCRDNLKNFKIQKFKIFHKNALRISDKFDYAVTDLPYGLNSNAVSSYGKNWKKHRINSKIDKKSFTRNLENFYLKFLKSMRKKLRKKAVIVFPSYVDYKKLLRQSKFRIEFEFEIYVHRSLSRMIVKAS